MSRPRHDVNLWVVPFKLSCAALLLFAGTLTVDLLAAYHYVQLPFWFTMGGIDDARAILGAMLGCVSTVLALIFSVTLLVLSMVANLFGPRLLYRFVQDWVTQVCIGLFMGAFIYVFLVFLVTHQDNHSTFIPQTCLITSWFVVLAAFAFLVFYSHRVALLIQNPDAIGRIVDDLRRVLKDTRALQPALDTDATAETHHSAMTGKSSLHFTSSSSGYLQRIDIATRTEWHRVFAWSKLSKFASTLQKGQLITLEGTLRYREVETEQHGKQRIAEIHATSLKRLSKVEHSDDPSDGAEEE